MAPVELSIFRDNTNESNTLSTTLLPGQLVSLIEIPNTSLDAAPSSGIFFSGGFSAPSFSPFTFFALSDGTKTFGDLLAQENSQITAHTGLTFTPFTIPTGPTSFVTAFKTAPFDPATVSIFWDANTTMDLANFGLEVEQPSTATPEPGTLLLVSICLLALSCRSWGIVSGGARRGRPILHLLLTYLRLPKRCC